MVSVQTILAASTSFAHQFAAIAGWIIVAASIAVAMILRLRNRRATAHIAALERLNELALATTVAQGEISTLFERVASAARELLHMPMSRVALLDQVSHAVEVIHRSGVDVDHGDPTIFRSIAAEQQCLRADQPIFFDRVDAITSDADHLFDWAALHKQGITSLVVLPLIASEGPVGMIILARRERGPKLTTAQRQIAAMLAKYAATTISNARIYQRMEHAIRVHRRVEAQRDTVFTVNTSMQRAKSLGEALERVAELAPSALDVEACAVCLAEDPSAAGASDDVTYFDDTMRVAAVTRLPFPFPLRIGMVEQGPLFAALIHRGRTIAISDTNLEKSLKSSRLTRESGVGSMLCIPLMFRAGRPVGAVLLTRRSAGKFSDDTIKFAEIFSSRAAIAIENARLQEQARRDAETKATLLRELNHRVKNNLAGLIGLLSIGTPPLSSEAQRWLDRAIERIRALARAHELFSAGGEVRLGRLIQTTLDSISAIKPDDVRVEVHLNDHDVVISAAQTVPAALVIYELAYNAVVHGAGEGGKIDVQVNQPAPNIIAIDIIDDGQSELVQAGEIGARNSVATTGTTQTKTPAAIHRGSGVGLTLVRGLVARELQGTFELRANGRGGTTASITFPIDSTATQP